MHSRNHLLPLQGDVSIEPTQLLSTYLPWLRNNRKPLQDEPTWRLPPEPKQQPSRPQLPIDEHGQPFYLKSISSTEHQTAQSVLIELGRLCGRFKEMTGHLPVSIGVEWERWLLLMGKKAPSIQIEGITIPFEIATSGQPDDVVLRGRSWLS